MTQVTVSAVKRLYSVYSLVAHQVKAVQHCADSTVCTVRVRMWSRPSLDNAAIKSLYQNAVYCIVQEYYIIKNDVMHDQAMPLSPRTVMEAWSVSNI